MPGDIHNLEDAPAPHSGFLNRSPGSFDNSSDHHHHHHHHHSAGSGSGSGRRREGGIVGILGGRLSLSPRDSTNSNNSRGSGTPLRHLTLFHGSSQPPPPTLNETKESVTNNGRGATTGSNHEVSEGVNGSTDSHNDDTTSNAGASSSIRKNLRVTIKVPDRRSEEGTRIEHLDPRHFTDVGYDDDDDDDDDDADFDYGSSDVDDDSATWERMSSGSKRQEEDPDQTTPTNSSNYARSVSVSQRDNSRGSLYTGQDDTDMYCCGLPMLGIKPQWLRDRYVSTWIVRNAPCFWFCWNALETGATDRSILFRLNYLMAFFGFVHMTSCIMLIILFYDTRIADRSVIDPVRFNDSIAESPEPPASNSTSFSSDSSPSSVLNVWSLNLTVFVLGVLGFVIMITTTASLRLVRQVNVFGAIRYLWSLLWILPIQCYEVLILFDYHRVTSVSIKHTWTSPDLAWFRELFCESGTAHDQCAVPIGGGVFFMNDKTALEGETAWCQYYYNDTDCTEIREDAQMSMEAAAYLYYTCNAIWGALTCLLLILAIRLLEGIITKPIVQRSRQHNIPGWLTLPIVGCMLIGFTLLYSPSSAVTNDTNNENFWIGTGYLICGSLFFIAASTGWWISAFSILNNRDKRRKVGAIVIFIATLTITMAFLAIIFSSSIILSLRFKDKLIGDTERGTIACAITDNTCSFCNNRLGLAECPEWSVEDVAAVTRTQLKQGASIAAIFVVYSLSAWRFGFLLLKYVRQYQIDYV